MKWFLVPDRLTRQIYEEGVPGFWVKQRIILRQLYISFSMATVVPCASCYARSSVQPFQLLGKGHRGDYLSLITYRGPFRAPRPRMVCHAPRLTLQQIYHLLKIMRQVKIRETAPATTIRKQVPPLPAPGSPGNREDKKCLIACFRRRRNTCVKRVG